MWWDILKELHKALRTESTWVFVLVVTIVAGGVGGSIAWVIDAAYKNSAEYKQDHPDPKPQAVAQSNNGQQNSATASQQTPQQSNALPVQPAGSSHGKKRVAANSATAAPSSASSTPAQNVSGPGKFVGNFIATSGGNGSFLAPLSNCDNNGKTPDGKVCAKDVEIRENEFYSIRG
jgi:hypothetical protein